ncbi:MAG: CRISPR-associated protein Cmr2 [Scytonematopsis contorta HA4267-MV1]|jgi:CRISPR-associated protein Cmr2|nr:CRISPR-associated protein Cmr2 [Scytonematopsis contorta HA4267-MV1]
MTIYTAISFAPVQGFIEKSRKLRDLFGASLILSYITYELVAVANNTNTVEDVISPGLINVQQGMPNRILIKGEFTRDDVTKTLQYTWKGILEECRLWIEKKIPAKDQYYWEKEWLRWQMYCWEVFWGHGESPSAAMQDLETRKLRRDWTGINWTGESSSLTGTDAIAWPNLGKLNSHPGNQLSKEEKKELENFYQRLAYALDINRESDLPQIQEIPANTQVEGKFLSPQERLSIPELVKRLVTRDYIANKIGMQTQGIYVFSEGFTDVSRKTPDGQGLWTGWFMGDGDKVGDTIKKISEECGDEGIKEFSDAIRQWGNNFSQKFPSDLGKIIYAGGDDFLGVIYSPDSHQQMPPLKALEWLIELPKKWQEHGQEINLSVGFVWAGSSVPQRDILQHCREAEKKAKKLGRERTTIRVLFNSGQYIQWTCPWEYLRIIKQYQDRDGKGWGEQANWGHIYNDLAQLKARHAIPSNAKKEHINENIALYLYDAYFNQKKSDNNISSNYISKHAQKIVGSTEGQQIIDWICGLINIGWHLAN